MTHVAEKLAESVPSWGARLVYGERTTVGGHEILPVALAAFGFGGGQGSGDAPASGESPAGRSEGSGGGGGGYAVPVGAYVATPDGLVFRPNPVTLVAVAVPLVTAIGMAVAQVVRAAR